MFIECRKLRYIYTSSSWSVVNSSYEPMFTFCSKLVGGNGTIYEGGAYSASISNKYAKIDGGSYSPGYFTTVDVLFVPRGKFKIGLF